MQDTVALTKPDGTPYYIWRYCTTQRTAWRLSDARVEQMDSAQRQLNAERALGDPGLTRVAHMQLDRFHAERLRVRLGEENPHTLICEWLDAIRGESAGDYHRGPPVALHLYHPTKGTGKTHLGAGAALRARAWRKLAVFLEHASYLKRSWSVPFAETERLVALPGDLAWLTVLDDFGQYPPGHDPTAEQKIWGDLINRRWLNRRWLIITSNLTIRELERQGTLTDAASSRLRQMTRDQVVLVEADDQRLEVANEAGLAVR